MELFIMQISNFVFVGLGGAAGAMLRYAISLLPYRGTFPLLTLITNLLGALAIGFIAGTAAKRQLPDSLIMFFKTGVCGGFTTFSTFSLEAWQLLDKGHACLSVLYILFSVIFCLAGTAAGMWAASR